MDTGYSGKRDDPPLGYPPIREPDWGRYEDADAPPGDDLFFGLPRPAPSLSASATSAHTAASSPMAGVD